MVRRRDALWALGAVGSAAALALAWPVRAQGSGSNVPAELAQQGWSAPRLQGQGRLRFLGLHVYDARLWVAEQAVSESDWAQRPLALELVYARRLVGRLIAERSLKEMQGLQAIESTAAQRWLADMTRLFPDVNESDRLTGIHRPGEGARFFLNGQLRGEIQDAEFSRLFFGIWLSPKTSEPALRERLLGRG